jgi:hypothetical protein
MRRNGYKTAEIVERTQKGTSLRFKCACGRVHRLGVYVFAHYHERLFHVCECGRRNIVKSGVVETPVKTALSKKTAHTSKLASDYKVGSWKGRSVIKHRQRGTIVAVFDDSQKLAIDFFTDILGT